jgi:hypothetical protein
MENSEWIAAVEITQVELFNSFKLQHQTTSGFGLRSIIFKNF